MPGTEVSCVSTGNTVASAKHNRGKVVPRAHTSVAGPTSAPIRVCIAHVSTGHCIPSKLKYLYGSTSCSST
eukprot:3270421-Rhodomonas_salina.1